MCTSRTMESKVKVAVRVRPMIQREYDLNLKCIVQMNGNKTILKPPPAGHEKEEIRKLSKEFMFDHCFWSANKSDPTLYAGQEDVFRSLGEDVLQNIYEGYNACIFAYGQTGSGKTYSMMGNDDEPGLIPKICSELFNKRDDSKTFRVEVSYMEIYNEKVIDLLQNHEKPKTLQVREHKTLGPYVENLSEYAVSSFEKIKLLITEGNKSRKMCVTNMNRESSRSHAVFSLKVTQTFCNNDKGSARDRLSKVSLVDLAGSERISRSGVTSYHFTETININKSLSVLGKVIASLAKNSEGKQHQFVNYRDSVLTWLLKNNLGGNSKTVMLATISPASDNYSESLSTLRFAERAKNVVNQAVVNEDSKLRAIEELEEEVRKLKKELKTSKASKLKELQAKLKESENLLRELNTTWEDKLKQTEAAAQEIYRRLQMMGISIESEGIKSDPDKCYLINISCNSESSNFIIYYLKNKMKIGSGDFQDIQLGDPGIKPDHCIIDMTPDGNVFLIPKEKSEIYVNGSLVLNPIELWDKDKIRLGENRLFMINLPRKKHTKPLITERLNLSSDQQEKINCPNISPACYNTDSNISSELHDVEHCSDISKNWTDAENYLTMSLEIQNPNNQSNMNTIYNISPEINTSDLSNSPDLEVNRSLNNSSDLKNDDHESYAFLSENDTGNVSPEGSNDNDLNNSSDMKNDDHESYAAVSENDTSKVSPEGSNDNNLNNSSHPKNDDHESYVAVSENDTGNVSPEGSNDNDLNNSTDLLNSNNKPTIPQDVTNAENDLNTSVCQEVPETSSKSFIHEKNYNPSDSSQEEIIDSSLRSSDSLSTTLTQKFSEQIHTSRKKLMEILQVDIDEWLDDLSSERIITLADYKAVSNLGPGKGKIRQLIDIILQKDEHICKKFLDLLYTNKATPTTQAEPGRSNNERPTCSTSSSAVSRPPSAAVSRPSASFSHGQFLRSTSNVTHTTSSADTLPDVRTSTPETGVGRATDACRYPDIYVRDTPENHKDQMQNNDTAMCENYLKDYTMNFSLNDCKPHGNQGYKRVLLQLFGYSGHGKSSFINTCKYVLDGGEYLDYTDVSSFLVKKTTLRNSYPLTSNISLVDNRGFTTMNDQETGEIYAQLCNLLPLNKEVAWQKGFQDIITRIVDHEADDDQSDFVVPIFIYSVKKGISQEEVPEVKTLLDNAKKITGLIPTVVLTFKSQGKLTEVEATFRNMGMDHIFKLENFTQTDCTKSQSRHEEVLKFLCEVLKDVKYRMRDKRDPEDERTGRKLFVLAFTHETSVADHRKRVKDEN